MSILQLLATRHTEVMNDAPPRASSMYVLASTWHVGQLFLSMLIGEVDDSYLGQSE